MIQKIRDVEWAQIEHRLIKIIQRSESNDGLVCYIASMGGVGKKVFNNLMERNDIKVIKVLRFGTTYFDKILASLLSSYWGVIKIFDTHSISEVFDKITEQTMSEIYIFKEENENKFLSKVNLIDDPFELSEFVSSFPDHFIYQVDADNDDSVTGIVEIINYGKDCPEYFVDLSELSYFR